MAYGAAGPMMLLPPVLDALDMRRVIIPPHPGLFSALGLVSSDLAFMDQRSAYLASRGGQRGQDRRDLSYDRDRRSYRATVPARGQNPDHAQLRRTVDRPILRDAADRRRRTGRSTRMRSGACVTPSTRPIELRSGNRFESSSGRRRDLSRAGGRTDGEGPLSSARPRDRRTRRFEKSRLRRSPISTTTTSRPESLCAHRPAGGGHDRRSGDRKGRHVDDSRAPRAARCALAASANS